MPSDYRLLHKSRIFSPFRITSRHGMLIREGGIFMKPFQLVIGSVLILIGGLSLLTYAFHLDTVILDNLWFLFVLIPGSILKSIIFKREKTPVNLYQGDFICHWINLSF